MKIQYASDLHLEFPMNRDFILSGGMVVTGDVLVLAGDIGYLEDVNEFDPFWDWCSENYRHTFIVPGNHEYYAWSDITQYMSFKKMLRENVGYYNNVVETVEGTDFIFSTLWSAIAPEAMPLVVEKMPDFTNIRFGSRPLLPIDQNEIHRECVAFIFKSIAASKARQTIVVTHHLPSLSLVAPEYQTSPITCAFATELQDKIESGGPDYWIYGHSHTNIDATIGKTQVVCNQLGYLKFNESFSFDDSRTIEIDR